MMFFGEHKEREKEEEKYTIRPDTVNQYPAYYLLLLTAYSRHLIDYNELNFYKPSFFQIITTSQYSF